MTTKITNLDSYRMACGLVHRAERHRSSDPIATPTELIIEAIELVAEACDELEPGFTARLIDRLRAQKDDGKTGSPS